MGFRGRSPGGCRRERAHALVDRVSTADVDRPAGREEGTTRRPLLWVAAVLGVVVLYLIGSAVIPRWWAQRVANVVDGRLTTGALYGLFIGFAFTVAPLLLFLAVLRWRSPKRTWVGWAGWVVLVLLTAAPNLMTLGIVLGRSDAAEDGETILDSQANGFRLWSLIGTIVGVAAVLGVVYLVRSRRGSRRRAASLRDELRARDEPPAG